MPTGKQEVPKPAAATVAVPLFGDEIAPRFCVSDQFLLVDVEGGAITKRRHLSLEDLGWVERLSRLAECGVSELLCGGFNRSFAPSARCKGIHVTTFLAGNAAEVAAAYARGEVEAFRFPPRQRSRAGSRGRGARAAIGGARGHCRRSEDSDDRSQSR